MFASKVVKPQTKVAADSSNELAPQRSALATRPFRGGAVEQVHILQRSIGSQATLPIPAQRAGSLAGNKRNDRHQQEVETASLPARGATPGVSWNFSKVPMFPPERANRLDARRSLCETGLPGIIQRKLVSGEVDDPLEHDAESVAAQVMRMPAPPPPHAERPEIDSRGVAGKEQPLQRERAATPGSLIEDVPGVVHEALRLPGQSLDPSSRAFFEPRFGHDFSRVRVHTDSFAARAAQAINALAYTVGRDLFFGPNMYAPHSREGRTLLAHELAHAVQQERAAPSTIRRQIAVTVTGGTMDPRHARGYAGEQGMGFGYSQENGWIFIEGPGGAAGHGVTNKGFDGVAYSVKADELHLIDNKSLKAATAGDASAITTNLEKNLDDLIVRVQAMRDVPSRIRILQLLKQMRASLAGGTPLPGNTKLVVTGVGGRATDVSPKLKSLGVEFREPGVTDTPISPAPNTPAPGTLEPSTAAPKATRANDAPAGGGAETKVGAVGEPPAAKVPSPEVPPEGAALAPAANVGVPAEGATLLSGSKTVSPEIPAAGPEATVAGATLRGIGELAIGVAVSVFLQWVLGKLMEAQIKADMTNILEPQVVSKLEQLKPKLDALRGNKKLFVRITWEMRYHRPPDPVAAMMTTPAAYEFGSVRLVNVHPGNEELDFQATNGEDNIEKETPLSERVRAWFSYSVLLDDPAKRARQKQQAALLEHLRHTAASAPKSVAPGSSEPPPGDHAPPLLAPPGVAAAPSVNLLPGAPGPSAADRVMGTVAMFRNEMGALLQMGARLVDGSPSPPPADIEAFRTAEDTWRTRATIFWIHFKDNGPDQARAAMDEILHEDHQGGRLISIRRTLGLP